MPELPEVETTRRGILPHVCNKPITTLVVREHRLRWPVPKGLGRHLVGQTFSGVRRRAKYLLFDTAGGSLLVHLGMSGSLQFLSAPRPVQAHEHLDIGFADGSLLRLRDPRRFGSVLWAPAGAHRLLSRLGPEPLGEAFHGEYLYARSRGRRLAVKAFLMDQSIVVGVGNIYASEALFRAGIHPRRAAGRISRQRYQRLALAVRETLHAAIAAGGTSFRDFVDGSGKPGYFIQELRVYDRGGDPCPVCGRPLAQG
ncbi:MAG: bifunctional DNA-formamidopyrimidine glycosylase/DNA-(apurinic or apyrimidinic site) lyase, partial [Gammaproteobacteria bacterium]|nr:bifunctional DNA-formamidopyrimidine glycosylase/DNA-(apurinic or apyrimidinic site) lyase [Gammaproteobacteria bacterium]